MKKITNKTEQKVGMDVKYAELGSSSLLHFMFFRNGIVDLKTIVCFVKLNFEELLDNETIQGGKFSFAVSENIKDVTFKLVRLSDNLASEDYSSIINYFDENTITIGETKNGINISTGYYLKEIDVTDIVKNKGKNDTATFALINDGGNYSNPIILIDSTYSGIELVASSTTGLSSYKSYEQQSLEFFNGFVELYKGQLVGNINLYSSNYSKVPFGFNLYYSENNDSSRLFFNNPYWESDLIQQIYFDNDHAYFTDSTGNVEDYHIITDSADHEKYGIKHNYTYSSASLYYCKTNGTYFYKTDTIIDLYTKNDMHYKYSSGTNYWKLKEVIDVNGDKITYNWDDSNNKLLNISSNDGETLNFTYSTTGLLTQLSSQTTNQIVTFGYEQNKIIVTKKGYEDVTNMTNLKEIQKMEFNFLSNKLISVKNLKTYDEMFYTRTNGKISKIEIKNNNIFLKYLKIEYYQKLTKVSNYKGEYLKYIFDQYGRANLVIDNNGVSQVNQIALDENSLNNVYSRKIVIPSRNLLRNGEFQENNHWTVTNISSIDMSVESKAIGEKFLKINNKTLGAKLTKTFSINNEGRFVLTGNIKRSSLTQEVLVNVSGVYYINGQRTEINKNYSDFSEANEWEKFEIDVIDMPKNNTANFTVTITLNSLGEYCLDNFSVKMKKHSSLENLFVNGYMDFDLDDYYSNNCVLQKVSYSGNDHEDCLGKYVLKIPSSEEENTKSAYQSIPISGKQGETFEFNVMAKIDESEGVVARAFVRFIYKNIPARTHYVDFMKNTPNFQAISMMVKSEDEFLFMNVGVEYDGKKEAYFDAFQFLYKESSDKKSFDSRGNLLEEKMSNSSIQYVYDEKNRLVRVFDADGVVYDIKYTNSTAYGYNNISSIEDSLGHEIVYTYNVNGHLIKEISRKKGSSTNDYVVTYDRDDKGNVIYLEEEGMEIDNSYDTLNRLLISSPTNFSEKTFSYYADNLVKSITNGTFTNSIEYSDRKSVGKVYNSSLSYLFSYDVLGNLTHVHFKNQTILTNYYETKNVTIDGTESLLLTNKLIRRVYDNGEDYSFVYNEYDELTSIKLGNNEIIRFTYDHLGNVATTVKDNIKRKYIYDKYNNLVSIIDDKVKISNIGSSNKLNQKLYDFGDCQRVISYTLPDDYFEISNKGYIGRLLNQFGDDIFLIRNDQFESNRGNVESFGHYPVYGTSSNTSYAAMMAYNDCISFDINKMKENMDIKRREEFEKNQTYLTFVYVDSTEGNGNIFTFYSDGMIKFTLDIINGKVVLRDRNGQTISDSRISVHGCENNLIGIKFEREKNTIKFIINNMLNSLTYNLSNVNIEKVSMSINEVPDGLSSSSDLDTPLNVYYLLIGGYDYLDGQFTGIYKEGLKHYFSNLDIPKKSETLFYSSGIPEEYEIMPLNGDFTSSKNRIPKKCLGGDNSYKSEKLRFFVEDEDRLVYSADDKIPYLSSNEKKVLSYEFDDHGEGKVVVRFKIDRDVINKNRTIVSILNDVREEMGVYINSGNKVVFFTTAGDQYIFTRDYFDGNYHTLFLDYNSRYIHVGIDGVDEECIESPLSLDCTRVAIGSQINGDYPLCGYIDFVAHSDLSIETSSSMRGEIAIITEFSKPIHIYYVQDELGRPKEKHIKTSKFEHSDSITYEVGTNLVLSETFRNGAQQATYQYDYGLLSTYNNGDYSVDYEYDTFGRLVQETNLSTNEHIVYSYDSNGNILTKTDSTTKSYNYNDLGRLINYNGVSITYDNVGYPTNIGGKNLSWENGKLMTYDNISYYYNDSGFRYKKVVGSNITEYILDNDKVIRMIENDKIFDFTYDDRGLLICLSYNGKEYFYVRDVFLNIIGIIDNAGEYVVKYRYSGYGEILQVINGPSVDENAADVRQYNPFLYKGYLYDVETQLFYCNSRYYSPELCRWISPDSIEYLDPQSINGLNLYCYCMNNPIMYSDPSGHAPWWSWALSGLQLVAGVTLCFVPGMQGLGASLAIGGATGLIMNVLEPQLAQAIGGVGSVANGYGAISTGISLMGLGGWSILAGLGLILIGAGTMAFGANEVVDAMTGTNYIQKWTGMSDSAYAWSYLGLNFASSVGQAAGNMYHLHATRQVRYSNNGANVKGYRYFDRKGNPFFDFDYPHGNIRYNHWHGWNGPGLTNRSVHDHWNYLELIWWMFGGM